MGNAETQFWYIVQARVLVLHHIRNKFLETKYDDNMQFW